MSKTKQSPRESPTRLQLELIPKPSPAMEGLSECAKDELRSAIAELLVDAERQQRAEEGDDE